MATIADCTHRRMFLLTSADSENKVKMSCIILTHANSRGIEVAIHAKNLCCLLRSLSSQFCLVTSSRCSCSSYFSQVSFVAVFTHMCTARDGCIRTSTACRVRILLSSYTVHGLINYRLKHLQNTYARYIEIHCSV